MCVGLVRPVVGPAIAEDLDVAVGSVDSDLLAVLDQARGLLHSDDCGQAVLAGHDGAVGHRPANLCHQAARRHEPGRPRSEEHTSELQSLMRNSYACFCLKKKKVYKHNTTKI